MELLIDKNEDFINLRHPKTLNILAQGVRQDGIYIWTSENKDIQNLFLDLSDGTSAGGVAVLIEAFLKLDKKQWFCPGNGNKMAGKGE